MLSDSFDIDNVFDRSPDQEHSFIYLLGYKNRNLFSFEELIEFEPIIEVNLLYKIPEFTLSLIRSLLNREGGLVFVGIDHCKRQISDLDFESSCLARYIKEIESSITSFPQKLIKLTKLEDQQNKLIRYPSNHCITLEYFIEVFTDSQSNFETEGSMEEYQETSSKPERDYSRPDQSIENSMLSVSDLFCREALDSLNFREKVLKLRALQHFQNEYICFLNIYKTHKDHLQSDLFHYLSFHQLNFKFENCPNHFIFIETDDPESMLNKLLEFKIRQIQSDPRLTFRCEALKYGKLRLQLVVRVDNKELEIALKALIESIKCVSHREKEHTIIFFYEPTTFVNTLKFLDGYSVEYEFCYYQPEFISTGTKIPEGLIPQTIIQEFALGKTNQDQFTKKLMNNQKKLIEFFQENPLFCLQYAQKSYNQTDYDPFIFKLLKTVNKSNLVKY